MPLEHMALVTKHPLEAFREANGKLSQTEAAKLVGITQPAWSRLESGKFFASPALAKRISELTGIALESLLNFGDKESGDRPDPATPEMTENPKDLP